MSKTNNTQFEFKNIQVNLDSNLFITKISAINNLRRKVLAKIETLALNNMRKNLDITYVNFSSSNSHIYKKEVSVCFNILNPKIIL